MISVDGDWDGMSQIVPRGLLCFAVDLHDEGAHEYAFPSTVACEVFDVLASAGCSILGGDLWKKVDGGFASGQEGWHVGGCGSVEEKWKSFFDVFSGEGSYFSFVFKSPLA